MKHIALVSQKPVMAQTLLESKIEFFGIALVQFARAVLSKNNAGGYL